MRVRGGAWGSASGSLVFRGRGEWGRVPGVGGVRAKGDVAPCSVHPSHHGHPCPQHQGVRHPSPASPPAPGEGHSQAGAGPQDPRPPGQSVCLGGKGWGAEKRLLALSSSPWDGTDVTLCVATSVGVCLVPRDQAPRRGRPSSQPGPLCPLSSCLARGRSPQEQRPLLWG